MPSSNSPLFDFTTPRAPPSKALVSFCAQANEPISAKQSTIGMNRSIMVRMAFSCSAAAVARIGRRAIRVPTTFLPQIAHQVFDIRFLQGLFVGGHPRPALANFSFHGVVVNRFPRKQSGTLEQPGELRDILGELVVA